MSLASARGGCGDGFPCCHGSVLRDRYVFVFISSALIHESHLPRLVNTKRKTQWDLVCNRAECCFRRESVQHAGYEVRWWCTTPYAARYVRLHLRCCVSVVSCTYGSAFPGAHLGSSLFNPELPATFRLPPVQR